MVQGSACRECAGRYRRAARQTDTAPGRQGGCPAARHAIGIFGVSIRVAIDHRLSRGQLGHSFLAPTVKLPASYRSPRRHDDEAQGAFGSSSQYSEKRVGIDQQGAGFETYHADGRSQVHVRADHIGARSGLACAKAGAARAGAVRAAREVDRNMRRDRHTGINDSLFFRRSIGNVVRHATVSAFLLGPLPP